ncbi:MAG: alpha/beta hydrolase [Parvibaculum sp.]|nr:alpha/beta hydrolase [Parvibaculum sp.]
MIDTSPPIVEVPQAPMPHGAQSHWLRTADGTKLRVIEWSPAAAGMSDVRGTVLLFGGRTEYAEKYFEVVGELIARGFAVATVDWRGQGLSDRALADPRKGHVRDYAEFDSDLRAFMSDVAPAFPKPWIGLAHSMGGNILVRAMHDLPDMFSAVVLTAPMLGLRLGSGFVATTLTLAAAIGKSVGLAQRYVPGGSPRANDEVLFEQNILTHDRVRYEIHQAQIRAEPALGLGGATYSWLAASFRSIRKILSADYLATIKTPLLIIMAGEDRLIDRAALTFAAAHITGAELVAIEGSHHEILIETDALRAQFWIAFDDFIARKIPVLKI